MLSVDKSLADTEYVFYSLKSIKIEDAGYSRHIKYLKRKKLAVPKSLTDQKRIAKVLSLCEQLIAWRKESMTLLDDYLEAVFLEMFGDPRTNEKEWPKKKISSIAESRLGKMLDKKKISGNYLKPYLGNSNVQWFEFDLDNLKKMDFNEKDQVEFRLQQDDILMCEGGEIGRCAIWKSEIEDCFFQKALHRIRVKREYIRPEYFVYYFYFLANYGGLAKYTGTSTISHLTSITLNKIEIPIPLLNLQTKFTETVEKANRLKSQLKEVLYEYQNLYSSISQRAFKSELDLSKIEIDEDQEAEREQFEQIDRHEPELKKEFDKKGIPKQAGKRTQKINIRNLSFQEYLGIPDDAVSDSDKWIFEFTEMDEFYQFLLKEKFSQQSFQYSDVVESFQNFFVEEGEMDFDHSKWKDILFKYLDAKPPLIEQEFDEKTGTIKIKLTDEAFEA